MNTRAGVRMGVETGWDRERILRVLDAGVVKCSHSDQFVSVGELSGEEREEARHKQLTHHLENSILFRALREHNGASLHLLLQPLDSLMENEVFLELWKDHQELRQRLQFFNGVQWSFIVEKLEHLAQRREMEREVLGYVDFTRTVNRIARGCRLWALEEVDLLKLRYRERELVVRTVNSLVEMDTQRAEKGKLMMRQLFDEERFPRAGVEDELMEELRMLRDKLNWFFGNRTWPDSVEELHEKLETEPFHFQTPIAEGLDVDLPFRSCPGAGLSRWVVEWFWRTFEPGERGGVVLRGE